MRIWRASVPALAVLLAAASTASAGTITSATGPIRVNDQEVVVQPGEPLTLAAGDEVETLGATVAFQSAAGDRVTLEPGTVARSDGEQGEAEYLFIESGAAYGTLSHKTAVGGTAGWASARENETGKVFVEVPANRPGKETSFRAVDGEIGVRYHAFTVWLPSKHSVTLAVDPQQPGVLAFRTSQQNTGDVEVELSTGKGRILAYVPKATIGRIRPEDAERTRIENDIRSLKTGKVRLVTDFPGQDPQEAALGPGTYALINNETGTIELSFTAVEFVILERAVSLTQEFATLSQSNFSDVGSSSGVGRRD
jgi:hypothetical protein